MEKNIMNFVKRIIMTFFALALTITLGQAAFAIQATKSAASDADDRYFWDAELVAFDPGSRWITVKALVVGEQAPAEIAKLKAGEKVTLTWSGVDRYTSGITHAVPSTVKGSDGRFTLPVEFLSYDMAAKYITFKTQVPSDGVAKIRNLKQGEWVTATSRKENEYEKFTLYRCACFVVRSTYEHYLDRRGKRKRF
jgi:hypothetical protein